MHLRSSPSASGGGSSRTWREVKAARKASQKLPGRQSTRNNHVFTLRGAPFRQRSSLSFSTALHFLSNLSYFLSMATAAKQSKPGRAPIPALVSSLAHSFPTSSAYVLQLTLLSLHIPPLQSPAGLVLALVLLKIQAPPHHLSLDHHGHQDHISAFPSSFTVVSAVS